MCPMIDEYYSPFMCRDVMASGMGIPFMDPSMVGMYGGGYGMYNTNYLGGVALPPKLNNDTFHIINAKDKENVNGLKTIGKALLGVIGFIALATIFKGKVSKSSSKGNWFSNAYNNIVGLFKRKSVASTPTPPPTP